MKLNVVKAVFAAAFVGQILFVGIGETTANGQGRRGDGSRKVVVVRSYDPFRHRCYDPFWSPYYGRRLAVDPIALHRENGFREGQDEGEKDAKNGRPADATQQKAYRKSKSLAFREAFMRGYEEGYRDQSE